MQSTVLAITPPFTQLNTPYPATAYLKGFLNTKNISCFQADLGIEVIRDLYSKKGFVDLFNFMDTNAKSLSDNAKYIYLNKDIYIDSIDSVISFLSGYNPTLVHRICSRSYLPEASRFDQLSTYHHKTFGNLKSQDEAKHLATLYIEDISDLIKECVDPHFGFSRYAERLGRSANSFDEIYNLLQDNLSYIDRLTIDRLSKLILKTNPLAVAISVPFPGNLFSAFRCAQWIKKNHPSIQVCMGGGFANTELRSLSDPRVFEFFDFISLDDGELPLERIVAFVIQSKDQDESKKQALKKEFEFKRTFICPGEKVEYKNNCMQRDYSMADTGTPDYSDLVLDNYLSVLEVVNPMHRLWSDGRWNKLTIAHGCYWGKCTFCDISLDYIQKYEPVTASLLCDRIESIIKQTGQNGFHFVDEAAPPARMRDLAIEILRRRLDISWWTNIRFEKSFSRDLCKLLKASGCIAVSGGLEVASDRLLKLIDKGVTVEQVAQVCRNFKQAGILVHAYLMYGYPTQTVQETVDSLEMVRQLFSNGVLKSGYWHQFAMTAHSPVGLHPEQFKVKHKNDTIGAFANNDLQFEDPLGIDHDQFTFGLQKSILNFMHGIGYDYKLQDWFDFKIPRTTVQKDFIQQAISKNTIHEPSPTAKVIWLGAKPEFIQLEHSKPPITKVIVRDGNKSTTLELGKKQAEWLSSLLEMVSSKNDKLLTLAQVKETFIDFGLLDFDGFWNGKMMAVIRKSALVMV